MKRFIGTLSVIMLCVSISSVHATALSTKSTTAVTKNNKAYKPKKKKFLGVFKRKSSCDCPKFK